MRFSLLLYIFIGFIFLQSCSDNYKIIEIKIGKDYDNNGLLRGTDDNSLVFNFKRPNKRKVKNFEDLFNYIYFQGDTICFSIKLNHKIKEKNINFQAYYISASKDKITHYINNNFKNINDKLIKMERVDYFKREINGFSLVGSILENGYKSLLQKRIDYNFFKKDLYLLYLFYFNNKLEKYKIIKYRINFK